MKFYVTTTEETKERQLDDQGSGYFGAPRGSRKHKGSDRVCKANDKIHSSTFGTVTKIGYPYSPDDPDKGHLRYVQVATPDGYEFRYFYINPCVKKGHQVKLKEVIGTSQDLTKIYKGITQHFHIEIRKDGEYFNPEDFEL